MANKPYKNYRNIYLNRKRGIHSYGWRLIVMNNKVYKTIALSLYIQ